MIYYSIGFSDWIERVADDVSSARCKNCRTVLPAHYAGLCNHARSVQHIRSKKTEAPPTNHLEHVREQDCISDGANIKSKSDDMHLSFDEQSTCTSPVNVVC